MNIDLNDRKMTVETSAEYLDVGEVEKCTRNIRKRVQNGGHFESSLRGPSMTNRGENYLFSLIIICNEMKITYTIFSVCSFLKV